MMAKKQNCIMAHGGQICVKRYPKTAHMNATMQIHLNRHAGRVSEVRMRFIGADYTCGEQTWFPATVRGNVVSIELTEHKFIACHGKQVTVEQLTLDFLDEMMTLNSGEETRAYLRIDNPGITIKRPALGFTTATQSQPSGYKPILSDSRVAPSQTPTRIVATATDPQPSTFAPILTDEPARLEAAPTTTTATLQAAPRQRPRRKATLPRSGCTDEQIDAGCMWRSDLHKCQCPPPQELTIHPFEPKGAGDRPGSIAIFPKTLQRSTVTRRYPKRRPGR